MPGAFGVRRKTRLVHGVGINDADYVTQKKIKDENGMVRVEYCPFYQTWINMLKRCYSSAYQSVQTTYIGCSVCEEWRRFSSFRGWMMSQKWEGMQLDKDHTSPGNKIYSPDFCVFIPQALNLFLNDQRRQRGEWPIGVTYNKRSRVFIAQCCNPFSGQYENLGRHKTPELAHEAWRKAKHRHACRYADMQTDPRIAAALRIRYLMEDL
jgi:hypothetical protein